ncbi:MAG: sigma-E factor negative regulatory protein [Pseudohongiellaceae bacterium]
MSEFQSESLSALLDGEADELELRRILQNSEKDSSLLDTWGRYNLVHSVLTSKATPVSAGFAGKVAEQLAAESSYSEAVCEKSEASSATVVTSWQQNLTKMAIAASVALVFIVGLQTANQPGAPAIAVTEAPAELNAPENSGQSAAVLLSTVDAVADPEAQLRLAEFLGKNTSFEVDEPVRIEHIQDSPLYRLVNNLQVKP